MPRSRTNSRRGRAAAGGTAMATMFALGAAVLVPGSAQAASHREAPLIAGDPQADNTDLYAFVSPDRPDTVTLIGNWIPFQEPNGGPNFYPFEPGAHYDINIDSDGDAQPDITYRWIFSSQYKTKDTFLYNTGVVTSLDDPHLNFTQTYDLEKITYNATGAPSTTTVLNDAKVAPSDVGPASMPDYASLRNQAITVAPGGGKSFAGQADDPFFLDLRVFDLLYGGDFSEVGNDTLSGYNVNTIALQVPKSEVALNGNAADNPVIGVWSDTERQSTTVIAPTDQQVDGQTQTRTGEYAQVSRLGNPLVNEVVIPLKDKDNFNNSTPQNDTQFLEYVQKPEVPKLIEAIYGIDAPAEPRNDLVEVFLTGVCEDCGPVGAALGNLNSQRLNKDVDAADFQPAEELRLNMGVAPTFKPDRLGVLGGDLAGFPNGRRLTDDVVDIELQALEGALPPYSRDVSTIGDKVGVNDVPFHGSFPYVALPHDNSVNEPGTPFEASRLAGEDRYGTAADIATHSFGRADTVLLASGEDGHFVDALAGNYLAGNKYAPVLLTKQDTTPKVTLEALKTLGADKVIILGGSAAVSSAQGEKLSGMGYTVNRIGGDNRYETAKRLSLAAGVDYVADKTAIVASGENWPDALVGGSLAFHSRYPVELTRTSELSSPTRASLEELGIDKVIILGGPAAVSTRVENQLNAMDITVTRLAGQNRSETAVKVADYALDNLGFTTTNVNLARGDVGADALAGGPNAGVEASPILLTANPGKIGNATQGYLEKHGGDLTDAHVYGGPAAVSPAVVQQMKKAVAR
jgi:putative cell wall-binding protein